MSIEKDNKRCLSTVECLQYDMTSEINGWDINDGFNKYIFETSIFDCKSVKIVMELSLWNYLPPFKFIGFDLYSRSPQFHLKQNVNKVLQNSTSYSAI